MNFNQYMFSELEIYEAKSCGHHLPIAFTSRPGVALTGTGTGTGTIRTYVLPVWQGCIIYTFNI